MAVAVDFSTIPEMFERITTKYALSDRPVLMYKVEKQYRSISYPELRRRVELFTLGLSSMGVKKDDKVAIIFENRPEWVVADMSIATLGAVDVPIYPTLSPPQIAYILNDAGVKVLILSNSLQLGNVLKIRHEVKDLQHIILMNEKVEPKSDNSITFPEVMNLGESSEKTNQTFFRGLLGSVKPEHLLTIIYTSGTTGNPKGVMLTHQNLVSNIRAAAEVIPLGDADTPLSFLPLCHSFERLREYAVRHDLSFSVSFDLIQAPEVRKLYEKEIQHLQKDLSTYERVRRFELLPTQLTVESGEITPTLKVKRKVVEKKCVDLIEKMYQNDS